MLVGRSSTQDVRDDPATPDRVRGQLELVDFTLDFAATLDLDVGGRYTSYVDWPGDRVVTSVVATRPGEVEPANFEFPIIGRAPYKGFFDPERAERLADELRDDGLDVCVSPVTAYSTLGWFDDPITTPMLRRSDAALVETILHELVHATVFVESQPEFNESVARFIGQEGSIEFFSASRPADRDQDQGQGGGGAEDQAKGDAAAAPTDDPRARVEENRLYDEAVLAFRTRVAALYAAESDPERRAAARAVLEKDARAELARLPLTHRDPVALAARSRLNDACLALRGTYTMDTQRNVRVLEALDGDLRAFVRRLREAAEDDDPRAAFGALSDVNP